MTRSSILGRALVSASLATAVLACGVNAREAADARGHSDRRESVGENARISQKADANVAPKNPFDFYQYRRQDLETRPSVTDCVKLRLRASDITPGEALDGVLAVANRCSEPVAVLTGPLEVRLRLRRNDRFTAELMDWAVYSVLYVFEKSVGLPEEAFLGDGGSKVYGSPNYYWVAAQGSAEIPVTGQHHQLSQLRAGSYGLSLLVPVVFASGAAASQSPFDLSLSVQKHNQGTQDQRELRLPPTAERLSAGGWLKVQPTGS